MEIKKDIFGVVPEIGDIIIFNPPRYKGLLYGTCVGFSNHGLPEMELANEVIHGQPNSSGNYTPKTGFVVYKPVI